jgi:hypothetical protein
VETEVKIQLRGEIEVSAGGRVLDIGSPRPQAVLRRWPTARCG